MSDVVLGLVVEQVLAAEVDGDGQRPRLGQSRTSARASGVQRCRRGSRAALRGGQQGFEAGEFGRGDAAVRDQGSGVASGTWTVSVSMILGQADDHRPRAAAARDGGQARATYSGMRAASSTVSTSLAQAPNVPRRSSSWNECRSVWSRGTRPMKRISGVASW
ncbi:hypothetical protein [Streptomyces sp. KL116D]|uniref:hypothetical protein n=1 Tax=Streptomyces sp. KL116D TaxID=3045152 RepID=UPI0035571B2C